MAGKPLFPKPSISLEGAYLLSPLIAIGSLWVQTVVYDFLHPNWSFMRDLLVLPWLFMFGGVICVAVEIFIVTPILLGFRRYRWRWLNGWSGSFAGFLTGAGVFLLLFHRHLSDADLRSHEVLLGAIQLGIAGALGSLPFWLSQSSSR